MKDLPVLAAHDWILRAFKADDMGLVKEASTDPLIPLITSIPTIYSEKSAREYIERQNQRHITKKGYSFAIADREKDVAVGSVFVGLIEDDQERATLGYWIIKDHRGNKILAHILPSLLKWIWDELKILRLELYVEPWNQSSIKIAESFGFQNEGLMRSWQKVGNDRKDMFMFSLLR
jgi:ribosomal-protein-alanine N-acetyltransferase